MCPHPQLPQGCNSPSPFLPPQPPQSPCLTGRKQSTGAGNSRTEGNLYFNKIVCAHAYIYTWGRDIYRTGVGGGGGLYTWGGVEGLEQQNLSLSHSFPLFGKGMRQVRGEQSTEKRRQSALWGSQAPGTAQTR